MTVKTNEILSHVAEVLMSKANGESSPMRQSFNEIAQGKRFSKAEFGLLLRNASKGGQQSMNNHHTSLWHNFKDGFGKKISSVGLDGVYSRETVLDAIIFSGWIVKNYSMIMGFDLLKDTPKLLCRTAEVSDFRTFVSYLNSPVLPELKKAYCKEYNLDSQQLKREIEMREKELIDSDIGGIEIIKPVPPKKWNAAKGPEPSP